MTYDSNLSILFMDQTQKNISAPETSFDTFLGRIISLLKNNALAFDTVTLYFTNLAQILYSRWQKFSWHELKLYHHSKSSQWDKEKGIRCARGDESVFSVPFEDFQG